jgi:protein gp37
MNKTKIEWCDYTWNPFTGCTPVSDGCKNCYAAAMAKRFWGDRKFSDVRVNEKALRRDKFPTPDKSIFVCSMSDFFNVKNIPMEDHIYALKRIWQAQNTFFILTKRSREMVHIMGKAYEMYPPKDNIFLGITAEDHWNYTDRFPDLQKIKKMGYRTFLSFEPLLESVDTAFGCYKKHLPDWVIVGQETGPKARTCKQWWVQDIIDDADKNGIPVFTKKVPEGVEERREFPECIRTRGNR